MLQALKVAAVAEQAAVQRVAAVSLLVVQLHLALLQPQTQVVTAAAAAAAVGDGSHWVSRHRHIGANGSDGCPPLASFPTNEKEGGYENDERLLLWRQMRAVGPAAPKPWAADQYRATPKESIT